MEWSLLLRLLQIHRCDELGQAMYVPAISASRGLRKQASKIKVSLGHLVKPRLIISEDEGQRDNSACTNTWCTSVGPWDLKNPQKRGRRESAPQRCLSISTCVPRNAYPPKCTSCTYIYIHTIVTNNFNSNIKRNNEQLPSHFLNSDL